MLKRILEVSERCVRVALSRVEIYAKSWLALRANRGPLAKRSAKKSKFQSCKRQRQIVSNKADPSETKVLVVKGANNLTSSRIFELFTWIYKRAFQN